VPRVFTFVNTRLRSQRGELHLAPSASGLHVCQHALEIPDTGGKRLHLAQPLVHLLQPVAHLLERLPKSFLQRYVEFFVHGLAHFIEFGRVFRLQILQFGLERVAHLSKALLVRFSEGRHLHQQRL